MKLECPFCNVNIPSTGGQCSECGYEVRVDNIGDKRFFRKPEGDNSIYSRYETAYEELAEDDLASPIYSLKFQQDLADQTFRHIGSVSGLSVADLGVGQGLLQQSLVKDMPKSFLSLDISERYVCNARKMFEALKEPKVEYNTAVGNVEFMPYRECFGVVVATDILEHVLNLANALSRICRMMVPNGRFFCRVPFEEVLGQYSIYNGQKYEFAHLRFFGKRSLSDQLREAGLVPRGFYYFGYLPGRFKTLVPRPFHWPLGKALDVAGFYGQGCHGFNRKASNPLLWPLRFIHRPTEILVEAVKK